MKDSDIGRIKYVKRESGLFTPIDKDDERCLFFTKNYDLIAHYVPGIFPDKSKVYVEDCDLNDKKLSVLENNPEKEALKLLKEENISQLDKDKIIIPSSIRRIRNNKSRVCRFCGRKYPAVTFRKKAHAISELLGNKKLVLRNECDECNGIFGKYELSLANYCNPRRLASQIKGKEGIPTYKREGLLRVEMGNDKLVIQEKTGNNSVDLDEKNNTISIEIEKQPYYPKDAFKALVCIALSIIPEPECRNFASTIQWLLIDDKNNGYNQNNYSQHVIYRFVEGPSPLHLQAWVFRRKSFITASTDVFDVPYCIFILEFANYSFQIIVPNIEKDAILWKKTITIQSFYSQIDYSDSLNHMRKFSSEIDLSGTDKVIKEKETVTFHFEEEQEIECSKETMQQLAIQEGVKPLTD